MPARPYAAVLCDIDGVLRHWPPADTLEHEHGLPTGAVAAAAFAPARLTPAITGAVTDEQWRAAIADDLAPACGSADRARAAVVATLVLVSNATTRLDADLDRLDLAGLADSVVNTSGVGFAKPDPRIYRVAAERAGAPVGRCLFVDDTEENVEGARAVGMNGLHYRTCAGLREALGPLVSG